MRGAFVSIPAKEALPPLANGIAVKRLGAFNWESVNDCVDNAILVPDDECAGAITLHSICRGRFDNA
jgi:threonine dehydratase